MTTATTPVSSTPLVSNVEHIAFETDDGIGTRANLGLIVLRTDQTIEDEFRFVLPAAPKTEVLQTLSRAD